MRRKISLKWFVALSFFTLTIFLIIGYSIFSVQFFFRGMDSIIADNMTQALKSYIGTASEQQKRQLTQFSGYLISGDWRQMPQEIKQAIDQPNKSGHLKIDNDAKWFSPPDKVFFAMQVVCEGKIYYISHVGTRETMSPIVGRNAARNLHFLIFISLSSVLAISIIFRLLLKRVERPVNALGQWANTLNSGNLDAPPPDFFYPELNELARLIQTSLSSVQKSLAREHQFLRHSSHELRTPISVIRSNVELLQKLRETAEDSMDDASKANSAWEKQLKRAVDRIDRAGLTMKHLTETLLWLSRDMDVHLPIKELDLERLIRELAAEANYLLKDKGVRVSMNTTPATLKIADIPVRIVVGNLIRNAFQHTWQGSVQICQIDNQVEIINDIPEDNDSHWDLGFGLGLQLTRQLCDKLKWPYTNHKGSGKHRVHIVFIY